MSEIVHGYPSTMQDDYQLTMGRLIRQAVRAYPDTELVHRNSAGEWGRTTYAENLDRIERGAAAFDAMGVQVGDWVGVMEDRKSTRVNSSHVAISYAVCC